jgi:hypothetical protein
VISEKALAKVSPDLDVERTKAEVTQKEYLDKMAAHIAYAKHSLGLDKILGRRRLNLMGRSGTWSCVRRHWWRLNPGESTPRIVTMS